jgi:hypothetical protein
MVSSSWADNEVMRHLDYRRECTELDRDKLNFLEIEFNLVVVKVKIFEIADSSSSADLFLNVLLDWGNVHEPKVIRVAKELKGVDGSSGSGCEGSSSVPIEKLFSSIFFKDAEVSNKLFVSEFV